MFFFIREGKYVTAINKFWFWISIFLGVIGIFMSCSLLLVVGQWPLGIIMGLLLLGCVIFDTLFLSKGIHAYGITACGYGIAATLLPILLQCVNWQSDDYIAMAALSAPTILATIWAMNGSKKLTQIWDEPLKTCLMLKGRRSRIPLLVLYVLVAAGIALGLAAVLSGALPARP